MMHINNSYMGYTIVWIRREPIVQVIYQVIMSEGWLSIDKRRVVVDWSDLADSHGLFYQVMLLLATSLHVLYIHPSTNVLDRQPQPMPRPSWPTSQVRSVVRLTYKELRSDC